MRGERKRWNRAPTLFRAGIMAKQTEIELPDGSCIPILYEDRAVLAIDKPAGWMLAPDSWDRTSRNLQLALRSSVNAGDYWARSRRLKYIRFVHRLDADTSGVLLLAKSAGALHAYSRLFQSRRVEKVYLAVVRGIPARQDWVCRLKLAPDPGEAGRTRVKAQGGKESETRFHVVKTGKGTALIEARPLSGRTHQIRVHLAESGYPVLGDVLYGTDLASPQPTTRHSSLFPIALRAVALSYPDPFQRKLVRIQAPVEEFCRSFGFFWPAPGP